MASALITGTSTGIGRACVAQFRGAGFDVIATVRKDADAAALRAEFPGVTVLVLDLTDGAAVERVIGAVLYERGGVDVLVNNAGASIIGAAEELALDDFRAQLELNLLAGIRLVQLVLPHMRARGRGRIVQVSSGFGRIALPMFSAYCAAKYALEGFSEALAHEVAPFGVGVALVEPGPVATRFDSNRREGAHYSDYGPYQALYAAMRARLAASHAGRASSADDVATVVLRAAQAARPALRYPVGGMGVVADLAARLVPDRLKQLAVGRIVRG